MHEGIEPRWVVHEETSLTLTVLLHLRDTAGASLDSLVSDVPPLDPVVRPVHEVESAWSTGDLAARWLRLWRENVHAGSPGPGTDPRKQLSSTMKAMGFPLAILNSLEVSYGWADEDKRGAIASYRTWTRPQRLAINTAVDEAMAVRGAPGWAGEVRLTSLPVVGSWSRRVSHSHLLLSRHLRMDTSACVEAVSAMINDECEVIDT